MFGYIRVFKPELKICEFEAYNAVYCGFCKALGKSGRLMKMSLSYDLTFYSLLSLSLCEDFCGFETHRCPIKFFRKKPCVKCSDRMLFASDLAVMMLYSKIIDDLGDKDKNHLKSRLLYLYIKPKYKKAAKRNAQDAKKLEEFLKEQKYAEENNLGVDALCDPTAKVLSYFFEKLSSEPTEKEHLSRLGYVLGRWIYLMDAVDDLEEDIKSGSFNPLKSKNNTIEEIKKEAEFSLNFSISEAQECFSEIKFYHFKPIIKNIIFLGLKNTQNIILKSQNKKERKKSLNGKSL